MTIGNSLGKLGPLFLKSIDLVISGNQDFINDELMLVYFVVGICVILEVLIIFFGKIL